MDNTTTQTLVSIPRFLDGTEMSIGVLAHALHLMERMEHRRTREPEAADFYRCWVYAHMEIYDKMPPIPGPDDDTEMGLAEGTLMAGAMALIADDLAGQTPDGQIALLIREPFEVH